MSSPYTPPAAPVRDPEPARGSPVKAVVLGVLVDVGGSFLAGVLITAAYTITLAHEGQSEEQIVSAMTSLSPYSWFGVLGMLLGMLASMLGGFVCAVVAKHSEYKLGAIVAAVSATLGLLVGARHYSGALNAILIVGTVALVFIGVRVGVLYTRWTR